MVIAASCPQSCTQLSASNNLFRRGQHGSPADPHRAVISRGLRFVVRHNDEQRRDLHRYFIQYGSGARGVEQFIQRNDSHLSAVLYRTVEYGEPFEGMVLEHPLLPEHTMPAAVAQAAAVPASASPRILWAKPSG